MIRVSFEDKRMIAEIGSPSDPIGPWHRLQDYDLHAFIAGWAKRCTAGHKLGGCPPQDARWRSAKDAHGL